MDSMKLTQITPQFKQQTVSAQANRPVPRHSPEELKKIKRPWADLRPFNL